MAYHSGPGALAQFADGGARPQYVYKNTIKMMSSDFFRTLVMALSWRRARVAHGAFAVAMAVLTQASAADLTPQEAVIEAISTGRDASVLLQGAGGKAESGAATRNTTGKQLAQALQAMARAVNSGNIESIKAAYERVQASAMLVQDDSKELKTKLADASLSGGYEARRALAQGEMDRLMQQLAAGVAKLDGGAQEKTQALSTLRLALSTTSQSHSISQVLRAALMPVRPLSLGTRTPVLAPAVRPSYETDQEVAATPEDVAAASEAPLNEERLGCSRIMAGIAGRIPQTRNWMQDIFTPSVFGEK